MEGWEAIVCVD